VVSFAAPAQTHAAYALAALFALGAGSCAGTRASKAAGAERAQAGRGAVHELAEGEQGFALVVGKLLTVNDADEIFEPGMLVVRGATIDYVGPVLDLPAGYERFDAPLCFAAPGMIDLHSHVQSSGFGDLNDMVIALNPEYRSSPTVVPGNASVRRACAGGVTTLFGIPGSGTNNGGFGVLYKTRWDANYEDCVFADPGGMKVAQAYNPERGADLGATRAGMAWNLERANKLALAANRDGRDVFALRNLQKVLARELPLLIHTAGSDACHTTISMWGERYPVRAVLSHGCFDGWRVAPYAARVGMPVNLGPRTFDWRSSMEGQIIGTPQRYEAAGAALISVNTDAPVMPQEELFLQGAMGARLGANSYTMLKACTLNPARSFGLDDRLGSLAPGKHADIVLWRGAPLDPRARVDFVWIEGRLEYDRERDGQRF
jgi:imidazolonepropionase-like amidohydrolase